MVCITFLYFCFTGYNFEIYALYENLLKRKKTKKETFEKKGGVFKVKGKQTISNKKNCYKCVGDCECIGVWEIDSTTV